MIVGGFAFDVASMQAGVLPRWTAILFLGGILLHLVVALIPVPAATQTVASGVRNAGLICMAWAVRGVKVG